MEVLFAWGPFKIYTLSVFVVLAFLWAAFVTTRRAGEYHLDRGKVFDLSMVGFIFGAAAYKALSLMAGSQWGFWYFLAGSLLGVVSFALWSKPSDSVSKWEVFQSLDIVSPGILMGMAVFFLGEFAAGGSWLSLVEAGWFLVMFMVGFGLEYRFRFWEWYRGEASRPRAGIVVAFLLLAVGLGRLYFDLYVGGIVIVFGLVLGYIRSGRSLREDVSWGLRRK